MKQRWTSNRWKGGCCCAAHLGYAAARASRAGTTERTVHGTVTVPHLPTVLLPHTTRSFFWRAVARVCATTSKVCVAHAWTSQPPPLRGSSCSFSTHHIVCRTTTAMKLFTATTLLALFASSAVLAREPPKKLQVGIKKSVPASECTIKTQGGDRLSM